MDTYALDRWITGNYGEDQYPEDEYSDMSDTYPYIRELAGKPRPQERELTPLFWSVVNSLNL